MLDEIGLNLPSLDFVKVVFQPNHTNAHLQAADATCSLSRIWLAMGPSHGPQAVQQLRSVLPTVLGNADADLQARVQLVLAQALLADATTAHLKADPEE